MSDAYAGGDLARRGATLIERATRDEGDANALMDLSIVLQLVGQRDVGLATQSQALALQQLYSLPVRSERTIRVLALMTRGDLSTNAPLEFLAERADVSLDLLYLATDLPFPAAIPEHDVLYIAINESDETRPLLRELQALVKIWPRPVINQPERILSLSRDEACVRLGPVPGVVMPPVARTDRASLEQVARAERSIASILSDLTFPIIVRPVGSHAGRGLIKCESAEAIEPYLQQLSDHEFYVSRFIDYSGTDGLFRKY
ncbi:MAG TPA: hypothetical protein VHZ95_01255, partial [Polyangiales bacterium]|nr:hypothetical protein [Polyangiales bacterium]